MNAPPLLQRFGGAAPHADAEELAQRANIECAKATINIGARDEGVRHFQTISRQNPTFIRCNFRKRTERP